MVQVRPGIFFGGEARYFRRYEGLGLDTFSGHALFLVPTVYAQLSQRSWIAIGWSIQVAGKSVDDPGRLDLINFERAYDALGICGYWHNPDSLSLPNQRRETQQRRSGKPFWAAVGLPVQSRHRIRLPARDRTRLHARSSCRT